MSKHIHPLEKLVEVITYKGVEFEVVERPDVLWVGCIAYADNNIDPAFADDDMTLLKRYEELVHIPKQDRINPDWSASISINYTRKDKPSGIMFAQETFSENQDKHYDMLTQPNGLWLRLCNNKNASTLLLGKDNSASYEYFSEMQVVAKENGYMQNPNVHIQVEYTYENDFATNYAYIPICRN